MASRGIVMVVAVLLGACPDSKTGMGDLWVLNLQVQGMGTVDSDVVDLHDSERTFPLEYSCMEGKMLVVGLTAMPAAGWQFDHWGGDCSGMTAMTEVTLKTASDGKCSGPNVDTNCVAVFTQISAATPSGAGHISVAAGLSGNKVTATDATPDGDLEVAGDGTEAALATLDPTTAVVAQDVMQRTDGGESRINTMARETSGFHVFGGEGTTTASQLHPMLWGVDSTGTAMNAEIDTIGSGDISGVLLKTSIALAVANNTIYKLGTDASFMSAVQLTATAANPTIFGLLEGANGGTIAFGSLGGDFFASALDANLTVVWAKTLKGTTSAGGFTSGAVVGTSVILGGRSTTFTAPANGIVLAAFDLSSGTLDWITDLSSSSMTSYFGGLTCGTTCYVAGALGAQPLLGTFDPTTGAASAFQAIDTATSNAVANNPTIVGDDVCGTEAFGTGVYCLKQSDLSMGGCAVFPSMSVTSPFTASTPTPTQTNVTITVVPYTPAMMSVTLAATSNAISTTSSCP